MNGLDLSLIKKSDDVLALSFPIKFRIVLGALIPGMIFLFVLDRIGSNETIGTFIYILGGISLLAGLYYEVWYFNREKQAVIRHIGLLFFFSKSEISLIDVDRFEIVEFGQRVSLWKTYDTTKQSKKFAKLQFITLNEKVISVEIINGKHRDKLIKKGKTIAFFLREEFGID